MFKRALGILALIGLFNILLCYQLNKPANNAGDAVYAQRSDSALGYIWSIFNDNAHAGNIVPQKTANRYLPGHPLNIPFPLFAFFRFKMEENIFPLSAKLIYPNHFIRTKLLPENQNYLYRLKPF